MMVEPLKLIAVNAGRAKDFFWISMDGAEESCNPESFIQTFPEFCASVIVMDDLEEQQKNLSVFSVNFGNQMELAIEDIVAGQIGAKELCLIDTFELFTFTKNEQLHHKKRISFY